MCDMWILCENNDVMVMTLITFWRKVHTRLGLFNTSS